MELSFRHSDSVGNPLLVAHGHRKNHMIEQKDAIRCSSVTTAGLPTANIIDVEGAISVPRDGVAAYLVCGFGVERLPSKQGRSQVE